MRRLRLQATILAALALCLVATSVPASAQSNPMLPPLAELTSVRFDYISTFNDEPGVVCQGKIASPARLHQVCQELVTAQEPELDVDAVTGRVTEEVYLEGTYYTRVDDDPMWTSGADPAFDPSLTLTERLFGVYISREGATLVNLGRVTVAGVPATQYQFWSPAYQLDDPSRAMFIYDLFISDQGFVLKEVASLRGALPMGEGELVNTTVYKDFNTPIEIGPPPAERVR